MVKTAVFSIIFLIFFCSLVFPQNHNKTGNIAYDGNAPEFWNNVRQMPVQFLEKEKDKMGNINFSAVFASNLIVEKINFVFPLSKKEEVAFFEEKKEWEEQIDFDLFLKKFKKDYWLTTYYKIGGENILLSAHQFKSWQSVKNSYAGNPEHLRRNVNDLDFWQDLRMTFVIFYAVEGKKCYWLFLDPIDKTAPFSKSDSEYFPLANGYVIKKRIANINKLFDFRVLQQGVLNLQENTVFHKQEMESEKARKVLKFTIFDAKLRLRPFPTDKGYFLENAANHFWICYYDSKFQTVTRLIESLDKQSKK